MKQSLIFPILLFSSISLHCSLKKAFLSLPAVLWNTAFRWLYLSFPPLPFVSLLFSAICKAASDSHFACLFAFLFLGDGLDHRLLYNVTNLSVHSSSGTLCSRSHPLNLFITSTYNHKGFDIGFPEWSSDFPYFLQFKSEFGNKQFMI